MKKALNYVSFILLVWMGTPALAWNAEEHSAFQISGFATINYSLSDQNTTYDRRISHRGSLDTSVIGVQGRYDLSISSSITAQVTLSPNQRSDDGYEPVIRWGYFSKSFENDWTLRIGRQRYHLYKNAENLEVGNTYTKATLPKEIYVNTTYLSHDGVALIKNFDLDDLGSLEAGLAVGGSRQYGRNYQVGTGLSTYSPFNINGQNIFVSYLGSKGLEMTSSILVFQSEANNVGTSAMGSGYLLYSMIQQKLDQFRIQGEYTRISVEQTLVRQGVALPAIPKVASNSIGIIGTWMVGDFKPYLGYARLLGDRGTKASQWSTKAGIAWHWDESTILKGELLHINTSSNIPGLFDERVGSSIQGNVLTMSYNKVF